MKKPDSYLALAVLAGVALYFALDTTSVGRGPLAWSLVVVLAAAVLWNLVGLGRRLRAAAGDKAVWHETRTLLFWVLGLMNTVWAKPGDEGSWNWWVGVVLLVVALADTMALYRRERRLVTSAASPHS
jgi:hypothetical protein